MACQSRSRSKASELIIRRLGISPAISACSDKAPVLILVMAIVPRGSSEKSHAGRRARVTPTQKSCVSFRKENGITQTPRVTTGFAEEPFRPLWRSQTVLRRGGRGRRPRRCQSAGNRLLSRLYASSFCDHLRRRRIFLAICEANTRFVCSAQLAGLANAGQCGRGKLQRWLTTGRISQGTGWSLRNTFKKVSGSAQLRMQNKNGIRGGIACIVCEVWFVSPWLVPALNPCGCAEPAGQRFR